MKRAALYLQGLELSISIPRPSSTTCARWPPSAATRSSQEYTDRISGAKARRPGLDEMMGDARRGRFDVVLVWASDRIARSVKHFLEVLDELNRLNIEFVSFREQIDTGGPLGRAIVVIIGAIAELERNLIVERVRAGMRRARLEGRHIGRHPLDTRSRSHPSRPPAWPEPAARSPRATASRRPPSTACSTSTPNFPGASRMIEESADFLPIWMLLSASFGFLIGEAFGDSRRHRKCLEQDNEDLREQLQNNPSNTTNLQSALDQQRRVINDIHKRIAGCTKGLEKRPS